MLAWPSRYPIGTIEPTGTTDAVAELEVAGCACGPQALAISDAPTRVTTCRRCASAGHPRWVVSTSEVWPGSKLSDHLVSNRGQIPPKFQFRINKTKPPVDAMLMIRRL